MIELPEGLVIISDEHCYIVGNPRKSRGKGVEIKNPKYYAHVEYMDKLFETGGTGT